MKVVGIGRNFRKHAIELGHPIPKIPFFFLKPESSVIQNEESVVSPKGHELHYEVELAIHVKEKVSKLSIQDAKRVLKNCAYGVGIDYTLRDIQSHAIKNKLPWTLAKGLDTFCPLSSTITGIDPDNVELWLRVNNNVKQQGNTNDQIFNCAELLSYITQFMTLYKNDVVLTGTPSGVGKVNHGDVVHCGINVENKACFLHHDIIIQQFDKPLIE